jgi:hypothetical protein
MDEPEPMPAFTFSPDGPTTITHPDGTVSVNPPLPDGSVTATPAGDTSSTTSPPEPADPQPEVTFTVPEPSGGSATPGISTTTSEAGVPADAAAVGEPPAGGATPADAADSDSIVNPDGSITMRLPDGSTQTVVRLPGGATIVTSTTPPGAYSEPAAQESPRSRRWRGRSR